MRNEQFPIRKGGFFCPGQEIEGLRGGVHRYAAQASPKIDAAWVEKNLFRTETYSIFASSTSVALIGPDTTNGSIPSFSSSPCGCSPIWAVTTARHPRKASAIPFRAWPRNGLSGLK